MDKSKLSYEKMETYAENLRSYSNQMNDTLNKVKAYFAKVGDDGVWSGSAASTTKEQFDILSKKFPEFSKAVSDCSDYLKRVVSNYKAADAKIKAQFSQKN
jgi:WXG100 family type VII secretion target